MRMEKIILTNYRQYRNLEIDLSSEKLHLIKGIMGTGKTNFLNAINWCFYQEEPYLKKELKKLPLLNFNEKDEGDDGEIKDVIVEIHVSHKNNTIVFTRTASFRIISEDGKKDITSHSAPKFEVKHNIGGGGFEILEDDNANEFTERIVPSKIRDFFFFDGERLDRYFKEATGINIKAAIFDISETALLRKIELRLNDLKSDFSREAGRGDPGIEVISKELEILDKKKNGYSEQIENVEKQIKISKNLISELNDFLKGKPKVKELQEERKKLQDKKKEQEKERDERVSDHHNLLFEYGKMIFLYPAIDKSVRFITEKIESGELPPTKDKELLERILKTKTCSICGTKFESGSENERIVKKLLNEVKLSGEVGKILQSMEYPLRSYIDEFANFKDKNHKEYKAVKKSLDYIAETENSYDVIANKLHGYEGDTEDQIRKKYAELEMQEKLLSNNTKSLGVLQAQYQNAIAKYDENNKKLEIALSKDKKNKSLKNHIDFLIKAILVLEETREMVMDNLRKKIKTITAKTFFDLMWRGETFEKVDIDESYNMKVYQFGYPVDPANISGGERECLALSFTTALHSISGFDVPILIDRPLAMVSGPPRKYICQTLLKLAEKKQILLFLTPDDYDGGVASVLNNKSCEIYEMKISKDEREVRFEQLEVR